MIFFLGETPDGWAVRDVSSNGTWLGGQRMLHTVEVHGETRFRLGTPTGPEVAILSEFPSQRSPYDYGGDKCENAGPGLQRVWWGRFAGGRSTGPSHGDSRTFVYTGEGCFPSANACEAWMLALKTKYNRRPIYNECRRGYEPGAPVPPWWAPKA